MNLPVFSSVFTEPEPTIESIPLDFLKERKFYRIIQEFTKAQYDLSSIELKAWLIIISQLKEHIGNENATYVFNTTQVADLLSINKRKARNNMVKEIFLSLMSKKITIENKLTPKNKKGEHDLFASTFISAVYYDAQNQNMHIAIHPALHKILFSFARNIDSVGVDLDCVLSLKRIASIRLFIAIKDLDERGINSISVDEFRKIAYIQEEVYPAFKELKRNVIKPVEDDIKKNTIFSDFSISDNGKRGSKATTIFFEMRDRTKELDMKEEDKKHIIDSFKNIPPSVKQRLEYLSYKTLDTLALAVFAGFDEHFFAKLPLEKEGYLVENILSALDYIHNLDEEHHKRLLPDERGRLIYSAIKENRANVVLPKEDKNKNMLVLKSETDVSDIEALYTAAAKKYLKNLSNNDFYTFVVNNQSHIEYIFKQKLDLNAIIKRDARVSSYKILIKYIILLGTKKQIDLGIDLK